MDTRSASQQRRLRCASLGHMKLVGYLFLTALVLGACASSKPASKSSTVGATIDVETIRPSDAAKVVDEFAATYGIGLQPAPASEVTSMAQVLQIVRGDRLPEYEAARRFTLGKHGAEALTLRAYLELSLAGAMLTAAGILEEQQTQAMTELRQLTGPSAYRESSSEQSEDDAARAAALRVRTEDLRKVVRALKVLSEEPLDMGADFARQAIRHDATSQLGYLASASSYRLSGQWLEFDRAMRYADDNEAKPPELVHLRAMEALERYANPAKCRELLRQTLAQAPDFVRAQAHLVLVAENVHQKYAELQKLKGMSPYHLVVRLAGPMIESEYETATELEGALEHEQR